MKSCPVCGRTYADDTFAFCLDDGARLSASYGPQPTLQIPAARETDQPRTEILRAPSPLGHLHTPSAPPAAATTPSAHSRGGNTSKVLVAVIVFLTAGVLLLGYLVWRNNQGASSGASTSGANVSANSPPVATPTPTTNNSVNTNAGGDKDDTSTGNSQWLEGVWEGTGYQHTPKMSWSVKFTAENDTYAIEYPSLRCGGKWTLVEMDGSSAKFKEVITRGLERCSSDGDILVEKISDNQVSYKYTLPVIGEVATAKLSRRAAP